MHLRGTEARIAGVRGIDPAAVGQSFSLLEQGPLRWAVEAASPIVGAGRGPGGDQIPRALGFAPGRAYAIIPFVVDGRLVALAYADNDNEPLPVGQVGELFEYCQRLLTDGPVPHAAPPPKTAFRSTSARPRARGVRRPALLDIRRPPPPLDASDGPAPPPSPHAGPPPPPPDAFDADAPITNDAPEVAPSATLDAVDALARQVATEQSPSDELERALFDDPEELDLEVPGEGVVAFVDDEDVVETSSPDASTPPNDGPEALAVAVVSPQPPTPSTSRPAPTPPGGETTFGELPSYDAEPFFDSHELASEMVVTPQGLVAEHLSAPEGRSSRRWLVGACLLFVATLAAAGIWAMLPPRWDEPPMRIEIGSAMTFGEVLDSLHEQHLIRSPLAFRLLARVSGADRSMRPGTYEIDGSSWPWQILDQLRSGQVEMVTTTIPEGMTLRQLAHLLEDRGITSSSRFVLAARDRRLLDRYGIAAPTAEGFLFPETYTFARNLSAEQILTMMLDQFFERLEELSDRTLPPNELLERVTLASIVEREAGHPDERDRIAGVFLNRINRDMRLESCATVQYVLDKPKDRLRIADLRIQSPYNTYLNEGLPPGPIANPGLASLRAALKPEEHDYLFFVAREDGSQKHIFTRNFGAHQTAQRRVRMRKRTKARRSYQ